MAGHITSHLDSLPAGALLPLTLVALLLPLTLLYFLKQVLYPTYDPREPPALWPRVPFVGHAYSIFMEGGGYFERL